MTIIISSLLLFSLLSTCTVALSEWRTLPTRVSSPEKMHTESWNGRTAEARGEEVERRARAGRKLFNSRSLIAANTSTTEVNALLAFRSSIQTDPTGTLANWTLENKATHCSIWKGVTCDGIGQVIRIELEDLGLKGTISPLIGNLVHLSVLNLRGSSFGGSIPPELGRCQALLVLDLSFNSLDGEILSELGSLKKLQRLVLEANHLNGSIPSFLGTLRELDQLNLQNNTLTGPIPPLLGNCSSLVTLWLGYNELNGTLPEELGNLSSIIEFGVEYNVNLTGPVPGFLSKCSKLVYLFLAGCSFTSIAPQIWSMKSLQQIALFSNKLTGELPLEVGNCTGLVYLQLNNNNLTGRLPDSLGQLQSLRTLGLSNNGFNGSIPGTLGKLTNLEYTLDLSQNYLTGNIPVGLGNLTKLQKLLLNSNALNGTIPDDLGRCLSLELLDLSFNYFTGGIPKFLGNFSSLVTLDLSNNGFNDDAVALSVLSHCPQLETFHFGQNKIYGSLQVNFTKWPSLKYFCAAGNQLTGGIPPSLGSANSSLVLVDFSKNGFTGELPAQVDATHLSDLRVLLFFQNQIEGSVPSWFGNLKSLQVLNLSFNKLTGSVPQTFGNLDGYKVLPSGITGADSFTLYQRLNLTMRGDDVAYLYILQTTTFMDMSSNALQGEISQGIVDLVGLKYLNLSNNRLEGNIWTAVKNLKALESLDLSQNSLSGPIPLELPSSVSTFKVSLNNLSGAIPTGGQFDTFTSSTYLPGNLELCGDVIHRLCASDEVPDEVDTGSKLDVSDYISLTGFGIGAAGGFCIVVITSLVWAPACVFVFGKRKATTKVQPGYFISS